MREIAEIELAIQGGTEKIESLGEQGKVDESMQEMAAVEALKNEKSEKEVRTQRPSWMHATLTPLPARIAAADGHVWRLRPPEAPCV